MDPNLWQYIDNSYSGTLSREERSEQRSLAKTTGMENLNQLSVRQKKLRWAIFGGWCGLPLRLMFRALFRFVRSPIHNWGVITLEPLAADEMIIEYIGEYIRCDYVSWVPLFSFSDSVNPTRPSLCDQREKEYEISGIGSSYLFK